MRQHLRIPENDFLDTDSLSTKSSLISEPEWRETEREKIHPSSASLRDRWRAVERYHNRRGKLLERLSRGKSPDFIQQLLQRQRLVKKAALTNVLLDDYYEQDEDCVKFQRQLCAEFGADAFRAALPETFQQRMHYNVVFWRGVILPAVFSLLIHSIAHSALGDLVESVFDMAATMGWNHNALMGLGLLLSIIVLRITGDIFFWARKNDHEAIKFDYHNRECLKYPETKVMLFLKRHEIIRAVVFILGSQCLYFCVNDIVTHNLMPYIDQRAAFLADVPSIVREEDLGICLAPRDDDESMCASSCRKEIERRGTLRIIFEGNFWHYFGTIFSSFSFAALLYITTEKDSLKSRQVDMMDLWKKMCSDSYDSYWEEWIMSGDDLRYESPTPLVSNGRKMLFYSAVAGFALLGLYGNDCNIWDNY